MEQEQKSTEDFGFSIIEINEESYGNLKLLIENGHKITINDVMNNGTLQGIVTPGI